MKHTLFGISKIVHVGYVTKSVHQELVSLALYCHLTVFLNTVYYLKNIRWLSVLHFRIKGKDVYFEGPGR